MGVFTFAIIGCNRLHYLRNCVESVRRFVDLDRVRLLVIDNASTERGMREYLHSLATGEGKIDVHQFRERRPSELYRAMNFAVEYARRQGDAYVHFIQEDCQFLWRELTMFDRVHSLFRERREVAQAHVSMYWAGKVRKWQEQGGCDEIVVGADRWMHPRGKPPCDTGITRVALFEHTGPYPETTSLKGEDGQLIGEEWMYAQCQRLGLTRVHSMLPSLGMIPDGAYVRGMQRMGRYFPPPCEFYLRPLNAERVACVEQNAAAGVPSFNEEFSVPDGWGIETMRIRSEGCVECLPELAA